MVSLTHWPALRTLYLLYRCILLGHVLLINHEKLLFSERKSRMSGSEEVGRGRNEEEKIEGRKLCSGGTI